MPSRWGAGLYFLLDQLPRGKKVLREKGKVRKD